MAGTHALLAPSAAKRWSRCPGSVAACKDVPSTAGADAASGTLTHELGQRCLTNGTNAQAYCGAVFEIEGYKFKVDQERVDRVQDYITAIRRRAGKLFVEVRLDTSRILGVPDQDGTGDAVIADIDRSTLEVRDLKDGNGIVLAPGNEQLLIYGAAALDTLDMVADWKALLVAIHQPRRDHYDEYIYTIEEVEREMARIRSAAQLAYRLYREGTPEEIEANLIPGPEQCEWCPIRGSCKKRTAHILEAFPIEVEGTEHLLMNDAELSAAYMRVEEIAGWCRDVRGEALKRTLQGKTPPGLKAVMGRAGPRKWKDTIAAEEALEMLLEPEQMYAPREVVSPTVAEKALKRAQLSYQTIEPLVTRSAAGVTLVPLSDNRQPVVIDQMEFELETENSDLI